MSFPKILGRKRRPPTGVVLRTNSASFHRVLRVAPAKTILARPDELTPRFADRRTAMSSVRVVRFLWL
jgi:hypothetical protein